MFYKHSKDKELTKELFQNPTKEYRGAPFWSWNGKLHKEELLRQIDVFKEMGFGGFYMHTRIGLEIPYMGEEYMDLIKSCADHADDTEMLACLYDEDKWPSGYGGGQVTKTKKFRYRGALLTKNKQNVDNKETALENGTNYFIAAYDIKLNEQGKITDCRMIGENEEGENKWYAYCVCPQPNAWTDYQGYVDVFNKEATERFLETTHEKYKKYVGEYFSKTVPSIFTDEPHYLPYSAVNDYFGEGDSKLPWSFDMQESFEREMGYDIVPYFPYLIWQSDIVDTAKIRHDYFDHITERFKTGYFQPINEWCIQNGIEATGHVLAESGLGQARSVGEAMRAYPQMGMPGIDILCNQYEYDTAKQVQSVAHQYSKEGVTSELYGVTNYDYDFRGFKKQGDWQAALGVTHRVPHLSWVTMKGIAKRDYPASISYQSPWYKEYSYIENHFARVNTALTRGKPVVKLGVLHPIESIWADNANNRSAIDKLNSTITAFLDLTKQLLQITVDFDYISESLLEDIYKESDNGFAVGDMTYSVVLLPQLTSIRKSTLDKLNEFVKKGGTVLYIGNPPEYVYGGNKDEDIFKSFKKVAQTNYELSKALEEIRDVSIFTDAMVRTSNLCYQMRQDNDKKWLFIAHLKSESSTDNFSDKDDDTLAQKSIIAVKGEYSVKLYDTLSGEIKDIGYEIKNGVTYINYAFYLHDSLLLSLEEKREAIPYVEETKTPIREITIFDEAKYKREEENTVCLDLAYYSYDGENYSDNIEEILRIDQIARNKYNYANFDTKGTQPYLMPEKPISEYVWLKFEFDSEIEYKDAYMALEFWENSEVYFNGENVAIDVIGYFVDKDIAKIKLGTIQKGKNEVIVKAPIGERTTLERYFILGDFDVELKNIKSVVKEKTDTIPFDTIVKHGMPFYTGNIVYEVDFELKDCESAIEVILSKYIGACVNVYVDGKYEGKICFAPYSLKIDNLKPGTHSLKFELFSNRNNAFGAFHASEKFGAVGKDVWVGPEAWEVTGSKWCYNYNLKDIGIMSLPIIKTF